jgi:hypothetical protein
MMGFPDTRYEIHYGSRVVRCFAERPSSIDAMFRDSVGRQGERIAVILGGAHLLCRA